jgi:hypothetical protein
MRTLQDEIETAIIVTALDMHPGWKWVGSPRCWDKIDPQAPECDALGDWLRANHPEVAADITNRLTEYEEQYPGDWYRSGQQRPQQ